MRAPIALLALLLAGACATTALSTQASQLRIVTASPEMCASLGPVVGSGSDALMRPEKMMESAMNDVLNKSAERGATHVVLQPGQYSTGPAAGQSGSQTSAATVTALAYRCK